MTVSELITLVNIGLGTSDVSACLAGDVDGDNQISVAEIVEAVSNAVNGCAPPTRAATATPVRVPSSTRTAGPPTPTALGPTPTPIATAAPTGTAAPIGPLITFLGLTRSDDFLFDPSCPTCSPPVYEPPFGYNFSIIVEAMPGASRAPVGNSTYNPGGTPALQIEATSALGNGSTTVCDDMPPLLGGVPAVNPPDFDGDDPTIADRLNDLGCRFVDGTGLTQGRTCNAFTACILGTDGEFSCHEPDTTVQFCGAIGQILAFPSGDTLVTARVADTVGNLGPPAQLIVRVP